MLTAETLAKHWLYQMVCDHGDVPADRAICCCGFATKWRLTVGDAAIAWAEHAIEAARALQPAARLTQEIVHPVLVEAMKQVVPGAGYWPAAKYLAEHLIEYFRKR